MHVQQGHVGDATRAADRVVAARRIETKEIASQLQISDKTVKTHMNHIFDKLQIHRRQKLFATLFPHEDRSPAKRLWTLARRDGLARAGDGRAKQAGADRGKYTHGGFGCRTLEDGRTRSPF